MSMAFFGELGIKSALVAGAALVLLALVGRRSASERAWIAHIGLLCVLLVPFAGEVLPRWSIAPAATIELAPVTTIASEPNASVHRAASIAPMDASTSAWSMTPDDLMAPIYLIPMLLLLLATGVAILRLFLLRHRASIILDQPWLSALAHAQARMDFKNGAALLVSDEVRSPVSWGLIRPTIVVDAAALDSATEAEAIIAHELAHVARLDWLMLLVARVTTALFWFNPLVWMLARQCHQLREEAADDAVLRADVDETEYAALLVRAARHESRGLLLAANGVAPARGSLHQRVTRVLDASRARAPIGLAWSLACVGFGLALGAPLAAVTTRELPVNGKSFATVRTAPMASHAAPRIHPLTQAPLQPAGIPAAPVAALPPMAPAPALEPTTPPIPPAPAAPRALGIGDRAVLEASGVSERDYAAITALYPRLGTGEVAALASEGISLDWLREMHALGYRNLPLQTMLSMGAQDVEPNFVRQMAALGYHGLSAEQLIAMRIHGVTPRFTTRIIQHQNRRPSANELIQIAIVGTEVAVRPPAPPGYGPDFPFDTRH